MPNIQGPLSKIACRLSTAVLLLTCLIWGGEVLAQTLAVPDGMPTLYEEEPYIPRMRRLARHRVSLRSCTIRYRGVINGYYIKSGYQEFVILNQNPKILASLEEQGKMVNVEGRTTERVTTNYNNYFIVINEIGCQGYDGEVGPCQQRLPTTAEIRYWQQYKKLPPETQRFMNYLALPKQKIERPVSAREVAGSVTPGGGTFASTQVTDIERRLKVIEEQEKRKSAIGITSKSPEEYNSTDWSLYMDSQGGG